MMALRRARRFRATIRKRALNPYVDVPATVSRAFDAFARAGKIRVAGALNSVPILGTLIPTGAGRHRLFVNGGMRSAAAVSVGDTVSLTLRAMDPDVVRVPADLSAALRRMPGARLAFDTLSPSYRRELIRYVDDARTPAARAARTAHAVGHALGRPTLASRRAGGRPLWICPQCGNRFVNRNSYHSCERHRLSEAFAGKPLRIRELFDRFRAMVEACGPVTVVPYRDRVGFMVRVRFAGAVPRGRWLEVGFWLTRRLTHPRFRKVETIYPNVHLHLLRIVEPEELDDELEGWIREAYAVGCQETIGNRSGSPGVT